MFKRDGEEAIGFIIVICVVIAIVAFIVYMLVLLAGIIFSVAAVIGVAYGRGTAIKNYVASFIENVIDSNKKNEITAA